MTDRARNMIKIILLLLFLAFCALFSYFIGVPMIRLAKDPEAFRMWIAQFGWFGKIVFILMVCIQVVVALIPGEPLELAAGYAFGAIEGLILSLAGIILGSVAVYLMVRRYGHQFVNFFFDTKQLKKLHFLHNRKKVGTIVFLLMLIPGTPKDLLSYFVGLTKLPLHHWVLIVMIARIPSVVTSTVTGSALGDQNYLFAAIMFTITLAISVAGLLYYRYLCVIEDKHTK